jgi:hypothetical protein
VTERALRVPEHVHWRRFDDEIVLVDLQQSAYFGLNDVAADAFERLAAGVPPSEVVRSLLDIYDVGAPTLERDIEDLVESLRSRGVLIAKDSAGEIA